MHENYSQALSKATQLLCDPNSNRATRNGYWRGRGSLFDFFQNQGVGATSEPPNCVVIAEFARWLIIGWQGNDTDLAEVHRHFDEQILLIETSCRQAIDQCDQRINDAKTANQPAAIKTWSNTANTYRLCLAITLASRSSFKWARRRGTKLADHQATAVRAIGKAAQLFDQAWPIGIARTATPPAAPEDPKTANEDVSLQHKSMRLMQLAERCGCFGNGVTVSTWLTICDLLMHIFDEAHDPIMTQNHASILTAGHESGQSIARVIPTELKLIHNSNRVPASLYLDPLSLGISTLDNHICNSLKCAWRCCIPAMNGLPDHSICISIELPELHTNLSKNFRPCPIAWRAPFLGIRVVESD